MLVAKGVIGPLAAISISPGGGGAHIVCVKIPRGKRFYLKGYGVERGKRAKKLLKTPLRGLVHHVSGPVGRTGGPEKKSFQGGTFVTRGF